MKAINAKKMSNFELYRVACKYVEELEHSKLQDNTSKLLFNKLIYSRNLFQETMNDSQSSDTTTLRIQLTAALINTYKHINAMEVSTDNPSWSVLSEKLLENNTI